MLRLRKFLASPRAHQRLLARYEAAGCITKVEQPMEAGRLMSAEKRRELAERNKRHWQDPEFRAKHRAGQIARRERGL